MPRAVGGDHHLSGLDAHSHREPDPPIPLDLLVQRVQCPAQLHRGARRPQRVVLMGGGDAEQADQHVADLFLDGRTVAPEHTDRQVDGARDDPPTSFRVRPIAGVGGDREVDEHDRHGPPLPREPGLRCGHARDGVECHPRRRDRLPGRLQVQRGILPKDGLLELPKPRSRLDPQLLDQRLTGFPVDLEGLGLSPRTTQRHHELASHALSERMLGDQRLQLRRQLTVAPERQVGLDPFLDRRQPELLKGGDLPLGEGLVGEVGQGRPAPQAQGPAEARRPLEGRGPARLLEQAPEPVRIDARRVDRQDIAGRGRPEDAGSLASGLGRLQALAEVGHQPWSAVVTVGGGLSPHSSSMSRAVETTSPACRIRSARSARPRPPGRATGRSSSRTSSGPKIRNSTRASPDPSADRTTGIRAFLLRRRVAPLAFL
jgi:hypothetical protein